MGQVLFKIGSVNFFTHGIFIVLAAISASFLLWYLAKKDNYDHTIIFDLVIYSVLAGLVGARITYFVLYNESFSNFWQIFKIWEGGLVSYGGFALALIVFLLLLRGFKQKIIEWLDILAVVWFLGICIGRLGSFLSGELGGTAWEGFLSVGGVHPITLYASIWALIALGIMLFSYFKFKGSIIPGTLLLESVMLYTGGRFLIDFLRADNNILWNLSLGQIVSASLFIVVFIIFIASIVKRKKQGKE